MKGGWLKEVRGKEEGTSEEDANMVQGKLPGTYKDDPSEDA